jgi:hypothetical protein
MTEEKLAKIVPLGGHHRSARSMLAEVMNDPNLDRCVVITFGKDDGVGWGHYEVSRAEMTYAAALLQRLAFDDE